MKNVNVYRRYTVVTEKGVKDISIMTLDEIMDLIKEVQDEAFKLGREVGYKSGFNHAKIEDEKSKNKC